MAIKQNTTAITTAAETFILSYATDLTSPMFKTTSSRASKMATYYLPTVISLINGTMTEISGPSEFESIILRALDCLAGHGAVEVTGHKVDAVSKNSAIIWLSLKVEGVQMSNVYFFRRMENGAEGFEGGIFDGEMWLLSQLGKL
jgi:hypothetical protein